MLNKFRAGTFLVVATCAGVVFHAGCGSDGESNAATPTGAGGGVGSDSGSGGSIFVGTGTGGMGGGSNCAEVSQEATLQSRPVDIIMVIDNSGSMGGEIEEVEVQITRNFAGILDAAVPAIDYRVIMVAQHGNFDGPESICIAQPLGEPADADMDGHCDSIPSQPTDTANFFHHSVQISSNNALCRLREQFDVADEFGRHPNGYKEFLRDNSYKFFLVITDDRPSSSQQNGCSTVYDDGNTVDGGTSMATLWDTDMLALSPTHFGAAADRNYTFWSIVSLGVYLPTVLEPFGEPHPPDAAVAPIITDECSPGSQRAGMGYQALSMLTGGYRFPTCAADENQNPKYDYDALFNLMAQGVIDGAQVDCEIQIPDPPPGQTVDLNTLTVAYASGGTPVETFNQVASAAECDASSFYIDNNTIILCPEACAVIQADENAKLTVSYQCGVPPQ